MGPGRTGAVGPVSTPPPADHPLGIWLDQEGATGVDQATGVV
jgi:hypothetical protein